MLTSKYCPLAFVGAFILSTSWVAVLLGAAAPVRALAELPAERVVVTEQSNSLSLEDPCGNGTQQEIYLYDRSHQAISRSVCRSSQWFDRFFASPDSLLDEPGSTLIRIIGAHRWQDNGETGEDVRVRASVEFPNLSNRVRLTFRNDDNIDEDYDTTADTRPEAVGQNEDSSFRAALGWVARQHENDSFDVEVGVRSELKSFVRSRYRIWTDMPLEWRFRFTESLYWIDGIGLGAESRFQFDRPLTRRTVLRLITEAEYNEDLLARKLGWDLSQKAVYYFRLSARDALQYSVGAQGYTEPSSSVNVWRTSLRYRRQFLRPWLYFELEPFVFWPRIDDYHGVSGVVFRLETQFGDYD